MLYDGIELTSDSYAANLTIANGASFPSMPREGELFFLTDSGNYGLHVYSSSTWLKIGSSSSSSGTNPGATVYSNSASTPGDGKWAGNTSATPADVAPDSSFGSNGDFYFAQYDISGSDQSAVYMFGPKVNGTWPTPGKLITYFPLSIKNVTGDVTLTHDDLRNRMLRVSGPINTTSNVTIPTDTTLPCPIGTSIIVSSSGLGLVKFRGDTGVSVKSPQSLTIDRKYGRVLLVKTAANEWEIDGQLVNQVQFIVNPIDMNCRFEFFSLSTTELSSTTGLTFDLWFNSNILYPSVSQVDDPLLLSSFVDYGPNGNGGQFATAIPTDRYFRATLIEGSATFLDNSGAEYNYKYYPLDMWAKFLYPDASNGYGASNPRWRLVSTLGNLPAPGSEIFKIRVDVSDSGSDLDIAGYFTVAFKTPYYRHLTTDFFPSGHEILTTNGIALTLGGRIYNCDTYEDVGNMFVTNAGSDSLGAFPSDNFAIRIRANDTLPATATYTGNAVLGDVYTGTGINDNLSGELVLKISGNAGDTASFYIDILSDKNVGSYQLILSDTVTLTIPS